MIFFNLVPTDKVEYQVYADWLEDQGTILTAAVRVGVLCLDENTDSSGWKVQPQWFNLGGCADGRAWTTADSRVGYGFGSGIGGCGHGIIHQETDIW